MQAEQPTQQPPSAPGPIDIHLDLSGLADLIWGSFLAHIGDLGMGIWTPLENTLRQAAQSVWDGIWHSGINIVTQVPLELTLNFGPYRAIATDPLPLAVGGATLALVLL